MEEDKSNPPTKDKPEQGRPQWLPFWFYPSCWIITAIRGYQLFISPMLGANCRYTPTCSQYFILAVKKYGVIRGSLKGIWRICRCHPFCKGGEDYP